MSFTHRFEPPSWMDERYDPCDECEIDCSNTGVCPAIEDGEDI